MSVVHLIQETRQFNELIGAYPFGGLSKNIRLFIDGITELDMKGRREFHSHVDEVREESYWTSISRTNDKEQLEKSHQKEEKKLFYLRPATFRLQSLELRRNRLRRE